MTHTAQSERPEFGIQEKAERERSALEARNLDEALIARLPDIQRYANPPENSPFPLEYCFHLLGNVAGLTVLDYGCGSGENLVHLASRGAKVIELDLSPELLQIARKRAAAHQVQAEFVVGSAYSTGMPEASVDVVFAIAIFHHLDFEAARSELFRILKPNGVVILQEPVRDSKLFATLRRLFPAHGEISPFEYPLTRAQMNRLCAGFQCVASRRFRLPFVAIPEVWFRRLARAAYRLDGWLLRTIPGLDHFATMEVRKLTRV